MSLSATQRRIVGLDESALVSAGGHRLQGPVHTAFRCLADAAAEAGFDLAIASSYRSFERQLRIWNAKLRGERPIFDDADCPIDITGLSPEACVACVLRFSAMPGASRHHWGTDVDVFDAAAVPSDYQLQLSAAEVSDSGPFAALHDWLDQRIASGQSFGFYRPYDQDRGGVAPERWHLSFAPLAKPLQDEFSAQILRRAWQEEVATQNFCLQQALDSQLDEWTERFFSRVAEPLAAARDYCPKTGAPTTSAPKNQWA